ncbi:MAG: primosomal protein [Gammaproteobacteria bacterium]|nr:primosomal protein [Gammaproteobacteria bacterium]
MKLITEHTNEVEYIVEGKNKQQYIKGIFMQSDIQNQNGRIYPHNVLKKQVKEFNEKFVKQDRALGELGHPSGPSVNLDRVSHIITELQEDGKNFIGKAKIIDTPNGKIVKNLLESGVRLGVSSRGLGSIKTNKEGVNEVQDDFVLSTVDIVSDPSAPDAFVNGIMEGREFSSTGILEYHIQKEIKNTVKARLEQKKIEIFQNFIKNL